MIRHDSGFLFVQDPHLPTDKNVVFLCESPVYLDIPQKFWQNARKAACALSGLGRVNLYRTRLVRGPANREFVLDLTPADRFVSKWALSAESRVVVSLLGRASEAAWDVVVPAVTEDRG
jgi:hypothetical protein